MEVLLIKLKNIGDTLLLTPVARTIKEAHPDSLVTVLVRHRNGGHPRRLSLHRPRHAQRRAGKEQTHPQPHPRLAEPARKHDWVFELTDNDRVRWITSFSAAQNRLNSTQMEHAAVLPGRSQALATIRLADEGQGMRD